MTDLILTTFDWVPELPRGYVRDLRVRWALEEAGLPYRVESMPFRDRSGAFRASALRTGAVADRRRHLDLRERRDPAASWRAQRGADADRSARAREVHGWLFAALNSVEMASLPWSIFQFSGDTARHPGAQTDRRFLAPGSAHRGGSGEREWLAGSFSIADIAHGGCSAPGRPLRRAGGLSRLSRLCRARHGAPGFVKAHADQMAHFAAAD